MKHARFRPFPNLRLPVSNRGLRVIVFSLVFGLFLTSISPFWGKTVTAKNYIPITKAPAQQNDSANRNARRVSPPPPRTGPPAANLPNLDEVKHRSVEAPRAPEPVPSTVRSPRKPKRLPAGRRPGESVLRHDRHPLSQRQGREARAHHARGLNKTDPASWAVPAMPQGPAINVAATANGAVVSASSTYSSQYPVSEMNDGDRAGTWGDGNYGCWADATPDSLPDWVQVDFNNTYTIGEVDFFSLQDNYQNPVMPTESMTFTTYGNLAFQVQYWTGNAWATMSGGSITGNNKVWRKVTFTPVTTNKIRVVINQTASSYSYVTEVEAWTGSPASDGSTPSDFAMARLDPRNRTGTGGEDLLSNNLNWSLPLVNLPGRSGMDLGLTLSYNSLVWTKAGNSIDYDLDQGSIAPGFRLGFPVIEGPYWNNQAQANFFLLISPAGSRMELRQVGNSIAYESKDSTYPQLIDNLNGTMTLRSTDGSDEFHRCRGRLALQPN